MRQSTVEYKEYLEHSPIFYSWDVLMRVQSEQCEMNWAAILFAL